MKPWQDIIRRSVTTFNELKKHLNINDSGIEDVISTFPLRINPYYLDLIKKHGTPLWLQAVPDKRELLDNVCRHDPLNEENLSPVPNLVHRYPDRALLLVTNQCAMYCRFCTRKRKVGMEQMTISDRSLLDAYDYLRANPQIKEILISGGDPLLLEDEQLDKILQNLHQIPSLEILRIGTRTPCTLPMRITPQLVALLRRYHPLFINTHFNHPAELTPEARKACIRLADAGIPLGNHTVLLHGVNDNVATMRALLRALLRLRIKPYYLFQADLTRGTDHFRTTTTEGIEIMRGLIGHVSGMAVPTFALDAPGGKGKIPLTPEYIIERGAELVFQTYDGRTGRYPEAKPCHPVMPSKGLLEDNSIIA